MIQWIVPVLLLSLLSATSVSSASPSLDEQFTNACFLGYGSYHAVVLAADDASGRRRALKCFAHSTSLDYIQHEYDTHRQIVGNCSSVVKVSSMGEYTVRMGGSCPTSIPSKVHTHIRDLLSQPAFQATCIVMDLAHGSLLHMVNSDNTKMEEQEAKGLFKQVFDALSCLHTRGIVHADIKPHNILVFKDVQGYAARLADFGTSYDLNDDAAVQGVRRMRGTVGYHSPELRLCSERLRRMHPSQHTSLRDVEPLCFDRRPGDVYAVGLTMKQIIHVESSELVQLLSLMTVDDPLARISMSKAREHAWFD